MQTAWVADLEVIDYEEAFELQKRLVSARANDRIPDTFLLLEHSPVFTANRQETFSNIIAPEDVLKKHGVSVCRTDRGGDVTYHGPGQIVGYNIMDLKMQDRDLHAYIRNVEQMLIDTLAEYDINAGRDSKHPGVWVDNNKIAAIGIAVKSGWITMHGFGLNVNPNMDHYSMIIACGISDKGVTSMSRELQREVSVDEVKRHIIARYGETFHRRPCAVSKEDIAWL